MIFRCLAIVCCLGLASAFAAAAVTPSSAQPAATDRAPGVVERASNPSEQEPMMLGPTPEEDAARYRRDVESCGLQADDAQRRCRDEVNREYAPQVINPTGRAGKCETLEGPARTECLNGGSADRD